MHIADFRRLGMLPLQDHRTLLPEHRVAIMCGRIEERDALGNWIIEGHEGSESPTQTAGDLLGGYHWPATSPDKRQFGSWRIVAAAIATEPSKEDTEEPAPEDEGDARSDEASGEARKKQEKAARGDPDNRGPSRERTAERAKAKPRSVKVGTVHNSKWDIDPRFRSIKVGLHEDAADVPKGTPLLVLAGSREDAQELVGVPVSSSKLIAPNAAGDPAMGTWVYDLTPESEPDKERRARLQSFWRVLKLGGGCASGLNDSLAWQLGTSGLDGLDGGGLVFDAPGVATTGAEPKDPAAPAPQGENDGTQYGSVTLLQDYLAAQADRIREAQGTKEPDQTRTRPPKTTQTAGGTPDATPVITSQARNAGGVAAMVSARRSGPIEVGDIADVHQIGQTLDGHAINAAHISCDALYKNKIGDGPFDFEVQEYEEPAFGSPFQTPVHLRWDAGVIHGWVCGEAPGKWRWTAESFFYVPRERTKTPEKPKKEYPPFSLPPEQDCQHVPSGGQGGVTTYEPVGPAGLVDGMIGVPTTPDPSFPLLGVPTTPDPSQSVPLLGVPTTPDPTFPVLGTPTTPDPSFPPAPSDGASAETGIGVPTTPDPDPGGVPTGGTHDPSRPRQKHAEARDRKPVDVAGLKHAVGAYSVFGGGAIPPSTHFALQAVGTNNAFGRPQAVPPPRVGDSPVSRRQRGVVNNRPTAVQTMGFGGGVQLDACAFAAGQVNLTEGGHVQEHVDLASGAGTVAGIGVFGEGTGSWESIQADPTSSGGAGAIAGGVVFGRPDIATPEGMAVELGFETEDTHSDPAASFYFPADQADLAFAHPDPTAGGTGIRSAGGTRLSHTTAGLKFQPYDTEGLAKTNYLTVTSSALRFDLGSRIELEDAAGNEETFIQHFAAGLGIYNDSGDFVSFLTGGTTQFESPVIFTDKVTVNARLDPWTVEFTDRTGSDVPSGEQGFRFDSAVSATRPLWTEGSGPQNTHQVAFMSDIPGAGVTAWTGLSDTPGSISGYLPVRGNSAGSALEQAQPPGCRVYNTSYQTISNTTITAITYNSESYDSTGSMHSTSSLTSRIVAPVAGRYVVNGHVIFFGNATGSRIIYIYVNGANVSSRQLNPHDANSFSMEISDTLLLAASDYVELRVYQASGGNLSVGGNSTIVGAFSVHMV